MENFEIGRVLIVFGSIGLVLFETITGRRFFPIADRKTKGGKILENVSEGEFFLISLSETRNSGKPKIEEIHEKF